MNTLRPSLLLVPVFFLNAGITPALAAPTIESQPIPAEVSLMEGGGKFYFQDMKGKSFYTYDQDAKNLSHCIDACARIWLPVTAAKNETSMGDWTLADRGLGQQQWTYKGSPIYTYVKEGTGDPPPDLNKETHWHKLVP